MGGLEFDEMNAVEEDKKLREQVESYNRRLREFEEQSKARSRHLAGLVTSTGHAQFPSHHHLQSDLLLEVSFFCTKIVINDGPSLSTVSLSVSKYFILKIFHQNCILQHARSLKL